MQENQWDACPRAVRARLPEGRKARRISREARRRIILIWQPFDLRVSIDHYGRAVHELERGRRSWAPTIKGLVWLAENGFSINVASRYLSGEPEAVLRRGFAQLFAEIGIALDADDPVALMIFPETDATVDVPEITEACWGILGKSRRV